MDTLGAMLLGPVRRPVARLLGLRKRGPDQAHRTGSASLAEGSAGAPGLLAGPEIAVRLPFLGAACTGIRWCSRCETLDGPCSHFNEPGQWPRDIYPGYERMSPNLR